MDAIIERDTHVLLCLPGVSADSRPALEKLKEEFFGTVVDATQASEAALKGLEYKANTLFFLCGDITPHLQHVDDDLAKRLLIVAAFCPSIPALAQIHTTRTISLGEVPRNVHGVGVYFPALFELEDQNHFDKLHAAHRFQDLTESTKPGVSFRKGIYLSRVHSENNGDLRYHLLRCSTNFQGPTDNFREVDENVVKKAQAASDMTFGQSAAELNHVLAQVYHNLAPDSVSLKEKKARIKDHSDKTKDMPRNGVMAFATFYSPDIAEKAKISPSGDYVYKTGSVLTKLRWRLKPSVDEVSRTSMKLTEKFDVVLHPNSLLLMPLSTNRLYTHEIIPPQLNVEHLPTRLGYVIRCSKTVAISKAGQTLVDGVPLVRPTADQLGELKGLYREENCSADVVEYKDITFSMNAGDYLPPSL